MCAFAASGVFFLKFWNASKDPLHLHFCCACWLLALERLAVNMLDGVFRVIQMGTEASSWVYLIRLLAYILIFLAVMQKNWHAKK